MNLIKKNQIIFLTIAVTFFAVVLYIMFNDMSGNPERYEKKKAAFYSKEMKNTLREINSSTGCLFMNFLEERMALTYSFCIDYNSEANKDNPRFHGLVSQGDSIIKTKDSFELILKTKSGEEYTYLCYE